MFRVVSSCAFALLVIVFFSSAGHAKGRTLASGLILSEDTHPASCAAPEVRQFDFWAGDWDMFEYDGGVKVGRVEVTPILDGCALRERYEDTNGLRGQSLSIYDASRGVWSQSWFTNRGQMLLIEGKFQGGEMTLKGTDRTPTGEERRVHVVWKAVESGVRESAVTSIDGGKTWKPWFDLMFRRAQKGKTELTGDEKAISALDTEYQAAVKQNDVAAMDRLLGDDFILVIGSGKVFSKDDLLNEARSRRFSYEHQEDSEQRVRVWGDTAVVTAKLWAKGADGGKPIEYRVWFSDTYIRTAKGWKYVFGQSSLPLPANSPDHK
ncbi:MAG TPA: nuclear transport factor 2 family protein [Candidatus Angelobacter sp.]|nr:nuclear transport factor 2 family protein [Candidatus Angelobacter sp.]